MMKKLKIMGIVLLVGVVGIVSIGCNADGDAEETMLQTAQVVRGDLVVDITAAGNLALSLSEDLAFEISGTAQDPLTVSEVLVEEGEAVTAGQLLLTLDVTTIEAKIKTREESLKTAELNLRGAEFDLEKVIRDGAGNVNTAEIDYNKAITDGASNVSNAEVDLERALDTYRKIIYPYTYTTLTLDVPAATSRIKTARQALNQVLLDLGQAVPTIETVDIGSDGNDEAFKINVTVYEQILVDVRVALDELSNAVNTLDPGTGTGLLESNMLSVTEYWALKTAEQSLEKSRTTLNKVISTANTSIEKAANTLERTIATTNTNTEKSRISYERSLLSYQQAEDDLAEAREELTKVEIFAPFDGFVSQVNVEGGDEVRKGTVAVQVADPDKFEASVLVNEMDIAQLSENGTAWVAVDSLSGVTLPATITHISPRANIQSGVVNYIVTVELASLEEAAAARPTATAGTRPQLEPGQVPERIQQAIDSGQMTQEQATAIMQRIQEGGGQAGGFAGGGGFGQGGGQGTPGGQISPRPQMPRENIQLRQGLSVTITLVVNQATDVLLVPNTAISYKGSDAYVKVMTASGDIEQRGVSVGISNWTNTVITDGLTEGETIVVSQTSASASGEEEQGGGGSIGSMGRMFR